MSSFDDDDCNIGAEYIALLQSGSLWRSNSLWCGGTNVQVSSDVHQFSCTSIQTLLNVRVSSWNPQVSCNHVRKKKPLWKKRQTTDGRLASAKPDRPNAAKSDSFARQISRSKYETKILLGVWVVGEWPHYDIGRHILACSGELANRSKFFIRSAKQQRPRRWNSLTSKGIHRPQGFARILKRKKRISKKSEIREKVRKKQQDWKREYFGYSTDLFFCNLIIS